MGRFLEVHEHELDGEGRTFDVVLEVLEVVKKVLEVVLGPRYAEQQCRASSVSCLLSQ